LFFSGNLGARYIRLENPAHPVRYQGVVCSLKESFGFIERGDVVREIFFHFSEAKGIADSLELGDDVEFTIQTRNVSALYHFKHERKTLVIYGMIWYHINYCHKDLKKCLTVYYGTKECQRVFMILSVFKIFFNPSLTAT